MLREHGGPLFDAFRSKYLKGHRIWWLRVSRQQLLLHSQVEDDPCDYIIRGLQHGVLTRRATRWSGMETSSRLESGPMKLRTITQNKIQWRRLMKLLRGNLLFLKALKFAVAPTSLTLELIHWTRCKRF
ncbi:hypothetical protein ACQJBY_021860 [Aegilops geniculata]